MFNVCNISISRAYMVLLYKLQLFLAAFTIVDGSKFENALEIS